MRFGLAERFGVAPKAVEARLDRIVSRAAPFIARVGESGFDPRSNRLLSDLMKKRSAELE